MYSMDIETIILTVILVWAFIIVVFSYGYMRGIEKGKELERKHFQAVARTISKE